MTGRIKSIDALRGLTIIGMTFCAAIGYGSGLPAWMFHCQVPPPDYVFHPEIRGITWVDLVFPFFIFSMGAAFPFALRKKFDRGQKVIPGILRRWFTLVLFALAIRNSQSASGSGAPEWLLLILSLVLWGGFFAALVRTEKKWINLTGIGILAFLFLTERFALGVKLSLETSDIIIMILSTVALTGSLIWLLTKDNIKLRWLIWGVILALTAVDSYTKLLGWADFPHPVDYIISLDWIEYLLIALPASVVGDMLLRGPVPSQAKSGRRLAPWMIASATLLLQLVTLFTRSVSVDIPMTILMLAAYLGLTNKNRSTGNEVAYIGYALLLLGIFFDPIDGGIAKDYCNISYLLVSGGMAAIAASMFIDAEARGKSFGFLSECGQNPMIAYTIVWFVIEPLLYAVGIMGLVDSLASGSIIFGLLRGVLLTALMCLSTCFFTRKKLFWRS